MLGYEQLTERWIARNCPWFDPDEPTPIDWNPWVQLIQSGHSRSVHFVPLVDVKIEPMRLVGVTLPPSSRINVEVAA